MPYDDRNTDRERVEAIRRRLLHHYDAGKRDLPWRRETDPYLIWVSEIMLQQTRVDSVIPYYVEWMRRFPTLEALAEAREEDVLKAWEGLGYYSRARRLLSAAQLVRERYGGVLPPAARLLRDLPGVGDYTAGAVASIAFGEVVPAVDGNVRRVLARMFDLPDPSPSLLRRHAAELVDPHRPGDFNQALMELGATVCGPTDPRCGECPVAEFCLAWDRGTVRDRPARKRWKPVPRMELAVLVAASVEAGSRRRRFLLRRRPNEGLLAGMWEFPAAGIGAEAEEGFCRSEEGAREAVTVLLAGLGLQASEEPIPLRPVNHAFSHLRVCYRPFLVRVGDCASPRIGKAPLEVAWVPTGSLGELPVPVAQQKIAEQGRKALKSRV